MGDTTVTGVLSKPVGFRVKYPGIGAGFSLFLSENLAATEAESCGGEYEGLYVRCDAAPDLLAAAKRQEAAEVFHLSCKECEGNEIPELCASCFPHYDEARVMRRGAIAKAMSTPAAVIPQDMDANG